MRLGPRSLALGATLVALLAAGCSAPRKVVEPGLADGALREQLRRDVDQGVTHEVAARTPRFVDFPSDPIYSKPREVALFGDLLPTGSGQRYGYMVRETLADVLGVVVAGSFAAADRRPLGVASDALDVAFGLVEARFETSGDRVDCALEVECRLLYPDGDLFWKRSLGSDLDASLSEDADGPSLMARAADEIARGLLVALQDPAFRAELDSHVVREMVCQRVGHPYSLEYEDGRGNCSLHDAPYVERLSLRE